MRCKACNVEMEQLSYRVVEIEDGKTMRVEEDLCSRCREAAKVNFFDDFMKDSFKEILNEYTSES